MRSRSGAGGLTSAAVLAVAAVFAVFAGASHGLLWMLGAPLVTVLPGYVWTEALLRRPRVGPVARAAMSVCLSFAAVVVGGLVLHLLGVRLDGKSWALLLGGTTLVGVAVAFFLSPADGGSPEPGRRFPALGRSSIPKALPFAAAAAIGLGAMGVSVYSARAQTRPGFTTLAISPTSGQAPTGRVVLGNHEHGARRYRVVATVGGGTARAWTVRLRAGATWRHSLRTPRGRRLVIEAFLGDDGGRPYRHVSYRAPEEGTR